jgi:hypothetical protein
MVTAVVLVASGCDEPQPGGGRVEGLVRTGASCPTGQQVQLCVPRAVDGEVQAVTSGGEVKGRARTNPTGQYVLTLAAGEYTLVVEVGGALPACPPTPIRVRPAATATVDIACAGD